VLVRAARQGTSVILSTHYIEEAERLSDRVAIISAGGLIAFGTIAELAACRPTTHHSRGDAGSLEDLYFDLAGEAFPEPEEAVS
jgi:ABC-type multidrug transport system ATPase subunit